LVNGQTSRTYSKMGKHLLLTLLSKISNEHNSATRHPIHFTFGSRVGFRVFEVDGSTVVISG